MPPRPLAKTAATARAWTVSHDYFCPTYGNGKDNGCNPPSWKWILAVLQPPGNHSASMQQISAKSNNGLLYY